MPLPNVILIDHPVVQTKLTELRDYTADHRRFRMLLDEIAGLMVYEVLLIDPMLATGGSGTAAASVLKEAGVASMRFVCLVASPEGIQAFHRHHPEVPIYCAAVDRELNE